MFPLLGGSRSASTVCHGDVPKIRYQLLMFKVTVDRMAEMKKLMRYVVMEEGQIGGRKFGERSEMTRHRECTRRSADVHG